MQDQRAQAHTLIPAWVHSEGPAGDVAISTRARLARNVDGIPFPCRARDADLKRVDDLVTDAIRDSVSRFGKLRVLHPRHLTEFDRLALVDTHVASGQHVSSGEHRTVVVNETGTLSLMVNEEDHLRIQSILPGFQPLTALEMVREFDAFLGSRIRYARTDNYGYLTASVFNVGTGFRMSAMLHLGGLAMLDEAVPALAAAAELKTSVRGLFGEGTKAFGDLFQVSNETTLGFSEKEIASRVRAAAEHLIGREREARRNLLSDRRTELAELMHDVRAHLMSARILTGREAMAHISMLRLGAALGLVSGFSGKAFNELLASMQLGGSASPRHNTDNIDSNIKRAKVVRDRLAAEGDAVQLALPTEP